MDLLESPLNGWHINAGAKMADFGGWQMPIEYPRAIGEIPTGGVLAEHSAVRERVGIFDVSHLGKIIVRGKGALDFLNAIFTNDLHRITDGSAQYNLLCNDSGGVIDDLIIYRYCDEHFLLIPNAANCSAVMAVLVAANQIGLEISNEHRSFGVLAIQGPESKRVLSKLGIVVELGYMQFVELNDPTFGSIIICRTGYTGEYGFELLPQWSAVPQVWERLVSAVESVSGQVCGLGSRDTLRTEAAYPLHGHELSLEITPIEASATWAVAFNKEAMHGGSALRAEKERGAEKVLRGIKSLDRGIPRSGMDVLNDADEVVGVMTSGTFSPTLKIGIGLALLRSDIGIGQRLKLDLRGRPCEIEVIKTPFVPLHVK